MTLTQWMWIEKGTAMIVENLSIWQGIIKIKSF